MGFQARRILMPVVKNQNEDIVLRTLAADVIVRKSNPTLNILEQLVAIANDEKEDVNLRKYIGSLLKRAATHENICQFRL